MSLILFDGIERNQLLPFTYTVPVAELRIGILKISEKWEKELDQKASFWAPDYLSVKYPAKVNSDCLLINGSVCPGLQLMDAIDQLDYKTWLVQGDKKIAIKLTKEDLPHSLPELLAYPAASKTFEAELLDINHVWDIFHKNAEALKSDFELVTRNRSSADIPSGTTLIGEEIFIEEGAEIAPSIINAATGPVYIGRQAKILEGVMIRNGMSLGDHSVLKMGTKIYGASTFGPHCKIGGEVSNVVLQGYSNKGHDGYLGNSVIGQWCNLGADTNCSNLKNDYGPVKIWDYTEESFTNSGLQFCGLMLGDHSKCSINTMFNTGTVVGVFSNIFGSGFPRNFIPSFSWGNARGMTEYNLEKAFIVAERVMARRNIPFDEKEKAILTAIFEYTKKFRKK